MEFFAHLGGKKTNYYIYDFSKMYYMNVPEEIAIDYFAAVSPKR